jgi:hypothetical protein
MFGASSEIVLGLVVGAVLLILYLIVEYLFGRKVFPHGKPNGDERATKDHNVNISEADHPSSGKDSNRGPQN